MFHVLAHFPNLASTELMDITAIADGVFGEKNNHFIYGRDLNLFAGFVLSSTTNLRQLQVVTPTMRSSGKPMLRPWNVGTSTPTDPNFGLMMQRAPLLKLVLELTAFSMMVFSVSGAHLSPKYLRVSKFFVTAPTLLTPYSFKLCVSGINTCCSYF